MSSCFLILVYFILGYSYHVQEGLQFRQPKHSWESLFVDNQCHFHTGIRPTNFPEREDNFLHFVASEMYGIICHFIFHSWISYVGSFIWFGYCTQDISVSVSVVHVSWPWKCLSAPLCSVHNTIDGFMINDVTFSLNQTSDIILPWLLRSDISTISWQFTHS